MLPEFFWITEEGDVLDCGGRYSHTMTAREEFSRRGLEYDRVCDTAEHAAAFELGWVRGTVECDMLSLQWHGEMAGRIRAKIMRAIKRMEIESVMVAEAFDGSSVYLDPEHSYDESAACSPSDVARLLRKVL